MSCGMCNTATTFSRWMDRLGDYKAENWLNLFWDDILIHTATFEQMIHRLTIVLIRLARYGLKLQIC